MNKKQQVEKIQENKVYNLKEIHDLQLIPWAKNYQTLRKIFRFNTGVGRQTRYQIRGSKITKYKEKYTTSKIKELQESK
jgi:hypothetical protein